MSRREIRGKFDEIVDFSGIGKFIDTPVKRYSSGMYVRLAFAVAAHLDPEVLIIDEVLAVGDFEFQQRCMGRIENLELGRTVIFVSHDMQSITRLCDRAFWLEAGHLMAEGVSGTLSRVPREVAGRERRRRSATRPAAPALRLVSARVVDTAGQTLQTVDVREPLGVEMQFVVARRDRAAVPEDQARQRAR